MRQISSVSVLVSWDRIDVAGITGYTVYYGPVSGRRRQGSEMSVAVPSNESSVVITDLRTDVEYQFQVVTAAEFRGEQFVGDRTEISMIAISPPLSCEGISLFVT